MKMKIKALILSQNGEEYQNQIFSCELVDTLDT